MIVYDLRCEHGHTFEGWFGSSADFERQQERGLVACPSCDSTAIGRAPMAPAVPKKGNQLPTPAPSRGNRPDGGGAPHANVASGPMPPEVAQALTRLAEAQAKALASSTWVGKGFAEQSRAMHYGERETAPIHGQASVQEAQGLVEEGIAVMPLPFPIAPPDKVN